MPSVMGIMSYRYKGKEKKINYGISNVSFLTDCSVEKKIKNTVSCYKFSTLSLLILNYIH